MTSFKNSKPHFSRIVKRLVNKLRCVFGFHEWVHKESKLAGVAFRRCDCCGKWQVSTYYSSYWFTIEPDDNVFKRIMPEPSDVDKMKDILKNYE